MCVKEEEEEEEEEDICWCVVVVVVGEVSGDDNKSGGLSSLRTREALAPPQPIPTHPTHRTTLCVYPEMK